MDKTKNIIIALTSAVILLMLYGCEKTDVRTASREITMKLVKENPTKASSISPKLDVTSFPHETFGLFANVTQDAAGTPAEIAWSNSMFFDSTSPEFPSGHPDALYINNGCFSNQIATTNGIYVGANPNMINEHQPFYWPNTGSLIFAAYAPHITQSGGKIQKITYENTKIEGRMGIMSIHILLQNDPDKTALPPNEAMSFDLLHCRPVAEDLNDVTYGTQQTTVPLHFKHAMSKLTFVIRNPQGQYKLSEAKLMNCVNSAIFFSGVTDNTGWIPNFLDKENNRLTLDYNLLASPQALGENTCTIELIVIPHQLNGIYETVEGNIDQPVILSLGIANIDDVGETTQTFDLSKLPAPAPQVWEGGMHYTYNITINAHKIEFAEPVIDTWTDAIIDI